MVKKKIYFGICLVLLFGINYQLQAGQLKLIKQVSLDDLGILKPTMLKVNQGNTYIYDEAEMSFFIINKEFKVIKKFGRSGMGPGEYRMPLVFGFLNNRLWVRDTNDKMIWYNLAGEFSEEKIQPKKLCMVMEYINADRYFLMDSQIELNMDRIDSLIYVTGPEKIKLIEIKIPFQLALDLEKKIVFLFAASKNSCYLVPSDKRYYIRRFDIAKKVFAGEIEKKDFQRIKYNEKEIAEFNENKKKMVANTPYLQQFTIKFPEMKPAVKQIYADEMDRLYIILPTTQEGKYSLELYDKTLKYLDECLVPATAPNLFFPTSDSIYLVNFDEKEEIYWLQVYSFLQ